MDAITTPPTPSNERTLDYAPDSPERHALLAELAQIQGGVAGLPAYVGGEWRQAGGDEIAIVQPHDHRHVLGITHHSTHADAEAAIEAAQAASPEWRDMPFDDRAAILLRAADLLVSCQVVP